MTMYEDKLDDRITPEQYDRKAKGNRSRQDALRTKIGGHHQSQELALFARALELEFFARETESRMMLSPAGRSRS